jgi:cysteinyl-tRNA synthetase
MRIYNTYSHKTEDFYPASAYETGIYSCGPTVYSFAHIGNMRTYIFMDILRRVLEYNKYKIKHVMNITDVGHLTSDEDEGDDKLLVAAERERKSPYEVAGFYTDIFFRDLERLNIQRPEIITKATDNIPEMIEMVKGLLDKGYAYETSDGIYFDIQKFGNYGMLSGMDFENQIAGARVDVNMEKRHPSDFALWKKAEPNHIMQWESPWGMGFPGWHIECSAMSRKYLGDTFDIHTGGVDHIPVHHENEIAQTEAYTGLKMARYWMHGEFLQVDGGKMSKSIGNAYTIDDLLEKGYRALDYRYFCLNANYRKKLNFTWEGLKAANISYTRMLEGVIDHHSGTGTVSDAFIDGVKSEFEAAVNDDLNIPLALASAWKLLRHNIRSQRIYDLLIDMDNIFGLSLDTAEKIIDEGRGSEIPSYILLLSEKRDAAKKNRDFAQADRIRSEISEKGYDIKDTREGTVISPKSSIL